MKKSGVKHLKSFNGYKNYKEKAILPSVKLIQSKMLIEIIAALLLGCIMGTFTGLIPGIHINLIGVFIVTLSTSFLAFLNPIYLVVFISSMAITHTFLDFIPSIFLGCPDTDTELSILPGHKLLKKGLGYEAVILTAYGSLAAIFILIPITIPSTYIISKTFTLIQSLIPYILIIISAILISTEKNKLTALGVFILTGFLGLSVLNLPDNLVNHPLLPLLTGLFGSSMLIISIKNKNQIPPQKLTKPNLKYKIAKPLLGALIASPLCSFLPGLGSGQAAIIGNTLTNKKSNIKDFLILLGATNTFVMGFSFISLYTISKTRTGAAVAIKDITGNLAPNTFILILFIIFISGLISFFLTITIARYFSKNITKLNYTFLSLTTLITLIIVVFIISNFTGLIILATSTLTGIYSISLRVRRTNMMGVLLIPTIIFYLL